MMTLEQLQELQRQIEEKRRDRDRAAGALAEMAKRLKEEFGCKTEAEGTALLKQLQAKEKRLRAEAEKAEAEFTEKWKDQIND